MGHHNHHFDGDPFANKGLWSPPTSAAKYLLRRDYAVTVYIAELINALSSLAYSYLAVRRFSGRMRKHDPLPVALFLVGFSSTGYHATLRQGPQFLDDMSMLFLGACLLQTLYSHGQTPAVSALVAAAVALGTGAMAILYIRSADILVHFSTFTIMVNLIWPRTLYIIYAGSSRPTREKVKLVLRFRKAAALIVGAFLVWNVDLEMYLQLRAIRHKLGLPWAWTLELHGWWHILTALGATEYVDLVRALCY
ncbi:alkaline phytoceramidase [Parathielavia appendiculata]|uniref:Alkaline phytoceramidase n=1 Tax=Parathielavia appendiculata TaxID=2587402 RepID=A0AAN6TQR0_9PEZI|nr:alkaline phytoceramidase [Parathielavia appendiculata]